MEKEQADAGLDDRTRLARPNSQARTETGKMINFSVQLTTSRIDNLTRLIHTLLYVMSIHAYIHIPKLVVNLNEFEPTRNERFFSELHRKTREFLICSSALSAIPRTVASFVQTEEEKKGQWPKRELPVLFGQKRMYPENNSGRECC